MAKKKKEEQYEYSDDKDPGARYSVEKITITRQLPNKTIQTTYEWELARIKDGRRRVYGKYNSLGEAKAAINSIAQRAPIEEAQAAREAVDVIDNDDLTRADLANKRSKELQENSEQADIAKKLNFWIQEQAIKENKTPAMVTEELVRNPQNGPDFLNTLNDATKVEALVSANNRFNTVGNKGLLSSQMEQNQLGRDQTVYNVSNNLNNDPSISPLLQDKMNESNMSILESGSVNSQNNANALSQLNLDPDKYSWDAARDQYYNTWKPQMLPVDTTAADNNLSNLGAAGHGVGSSSVGKQLRYRDSLLTDGDLKRIGLIQDGNINELKAQGLIPSIVSNISAAGQKPLMDATAAVADNSSKIGGLNARDREEYNKNIANVGNAQISNFDKKSQEQMALHNEDIGSAERLNSIDTNAIKFYDDLRDKVYAIDLQGLNFNADDERRAQELYNQRTEIELMLRRDGREAEALLLSKQKDTRSFVQTLVSILAKLGGRFFGMR